MFSKGTYIFRNYNLQEITNKIIKTNMKESTFKWMNRILVDWNISRIIRMVFGIGLCVMGITSKENVITLFGALLMFQGIFNLSCCGAGGCSLSNDKRQVYKDIIKPYKPKK